MSASRFGQHFCRIQNYTKVDPRQRERNYNWTLDKRFLMLKSFSSKLFLNYFSQIRALEAVLV